MTRCYHVTIYHANIGHLRDPLCHKVLNSSRLGTFHANQVFQAEAIGNSDENKEL